MSRMQVQPDVQLKFHAHMRVKDSSLAVIQIIMMQGVDRVAQRGICGRNSPFDFLLKVFAC